MSAKGKKRVKLIKTVTRQAQLANSRARKLAIKNAEARKKKRAEYANKLQGTKP